MHLLWGKSHLYVNSCARDVSSATNGIGHPKWRKNTLKKSGVVPCTCSEIMHCKLWLLQDKWNVSHAATLIDVSGIIVVHALATCGTKHQFWKYPLVFLLQNVPLFKAILEVKYEALVCYPLFESFFSYSPQPEAMFVL